jgi:SAM-dependent methyltransferase
MREKVVEIFIEKLTPYLNTINSVAIVGGDTTDPEIQELIKLKQINVDCYGIDQGLIHLDLNLPYNNKNKYDLVICSQVLEHLYDVKQAIENLTNLTNSSGYIWIGCPASNRSHGSPHYYSAGYQPEMIVNLLKLFSTKILFFGKLGSKRLYFMTHALRIWPSQKELKSPIFGYDINRRNENLAKRIIRFIYDFPGRFYSLFLSYSTTDQIEYATESYVFAAKV